MNDDPARSLSRLRPFPGLRPFDVADHEFFFGRKEQINTLYGLLDFSYFIAIVGSSGSGKSSLVRAGLLPLLHEESAGAGGRKWRVATMRPGNTPMANLVEALVALVPEAERDARRSTVEYALRSTLGLPDAAKAVLSGNDASLLILVDQFEELFRYANVESSERSEVDRREDAIHFVQLLMGAAQLRSNSVYVLVTMRSDFIGDCAQFDGLPEAVSASQFLVPALTRDEREEVIRKPIEVAGATIDARLVNRLLNDPASKSDQLPVLQHALMRTWDIWLADGRPDEAIGIPDYERTGGLAEAMSRHGDEVYESLADDAQRSIAERLFKCLSDPGPDNRGIRRPTRFAEACAIVGTSPEELSAVVAAFRAPSCAFLMPPTADGMIDISHESLMRLWGRLRSWIKEQEESTQTYCALASAAYDHECRRHGLYRDPELALALKWYGQEQPNAAWAERYGQRGDKAEDFDGTLRFLKASVRRRTLERAAALVTAAIFVVGAAYVAITDHMRAQSFIADTLAAVSQEHLAVTGGDVHAYLLAAQAYATEATAESKRALLDNLVNAEQDALARTAAPPWKHAAFASSGNTTLLGILTTGSEHPALVIYSAEDLRYVTAATLPFDATMLCGFDNRLGQFALADGDHTAIYSLSADGVVQVKKRLGAADAIGCLPDGRVAIAQTGGNVILWGGSSPRTAPIGRADPPVKALAISPAGTFVAAVTDSAIDVFSTTTRWRARYATARPLCSIDQCSPPVAFRSDEGRLAWYDGKNVHVAMLPGAPGGAADLANGGVYPVRCLSGTQNPGRVTLATYTQVNPAYGTGKPWLPDLLASNGNDSLCRYDTNKGSYRTILRFAGNPQTSPIFDPALSAFAVRGAQYNQADYDGRADGLVLRAASNASAPFLGGHLAAYASSWGLYGGSVIFSSTWKGHEEWQVIDLRHFRSDLQSTFIAGHIRLRTSYDGLHALAVDYDTGYVYAVDLSKIPACPPERPHCDPVGAHGEMRRFGTLRLWKTPPSRDPILSMAYDPNHLVTIAYRGRIVRYSESGGSSTLRYPAGNWRVELTGRGTYVTLTSASGEHKIMRTDGGALQHGYYFVSDDEKYALGAEAGSDMPALYTMPDERVWKQGVELSDPASTQMAFWDHRTWAALSPQPGTAGPNARDSIRVIDMQDIGGWQGVTLPDPPWWPGHGVLAFSPDGEYLLVEYRRSTDDRRFVAIYSIAPQAWLRDLCLTVDHNLVSASPEVADAEMGRLTDKAVPVDSRVCPDLALPAVPNFWFSGAPSSQPGNPG